MKTAHLLKKERWYQKVAIDSAELDLLCNFLTDDVRKDGRSFKEWINSSHEETGSNATYLEKYDDDNEIHLSSDYADDGFVFITTKEQLFSIIEQWEKLYQQQPDEIIISQDDIGKITLIGASGDTCHKHMLNKI